MKRFALTILIMLSHVALAFAVDSLAVVYRIRLDSDIDKSAQRLVLFWRFLQSLLSNCTKIIKNIVCYVP